jgi:preprotein translocase SecE subunit
MSFGIIKPGQGYWVRVMTACLLAVATLASAGWLYHQGALIAEKLVPSKGWAVNIAAGSVAPTPGQAVELLGRRESSVEAPVIGTAKVVSFEPQRGNRVVFAEVAMKGEADVSQTNQLRAAENRGAAGSSFDAVKAGEVPVLPVPVIEPALLQGVLAGVVILIGSFLTYFFVARRASTVEFLIATDQEMKKVNWSTPREIIGSTWVVVGASVLIAASLFMFDLGFKTFFQLIGVLAG